LRREALKYTAIRPLIGSDENSVIHLQTALSKGPGDQITYAIVMQLAQAGFIRKTNWLRATVKR